MTQLSERSLSHFNDIYTWCSSGKKYSVDCDKWIDDKLIVDKCLLQLKLILLLYNLW